MTEPLRVTLDALIGDDPLAVLAIAGVVADEPGSITDFRMLPSHVGFSAADIVTCACNRPPSTETAPEWGPRYHRVRTDKRYEVITKAGQHAGILYGICPGCRTLYFISIKYRYKSIVAGRKTAERV